jgi:hypothetical protein
MPAFAGMTALGTFYEAVNSEHRTVGFLPSAECPQDAKHDMLTKPCDVGSALAKKAAAGQVFDVHFQYVMKPYFPF